MRSRSSDGKQHDTLFVERTNEPFSVTIISLDVRSEGGRAYKVIDDEKRRFDLREDQVIEVFRQTGIEPGGRIPSEFVWGVLGSQVRMVLVGGEMHSEMLRCTEALREAKQQRKSGVAPKQSTFVPGRVYRKRDQSLHVFVGKAKVPDSKKPLFAFVELPEAPDDHAGEDLDGAEAAVFHYIEVARKEREVAKKWPSMSWLERCEWSRQARYTETTYYEDIVMLSSPKFDAETSDDCTELVEQFRLNAGSQHKYVDGFRQDLAENRYQKANGGQSRVWYPRAGWDDFSWWRRSESERQKITAEQHKKTMAEYIETRAQFQREITWL